LKNERIFTVLSHCSIRVFTFHLSADAGGLVLLAINRPSAAKETDHHLVARVSRGHQLPLQDEPLCFDAILSEKLLAERWHNTFPSWTPFCVLHVPAFIQMLIKPITLQRTD